MTLCIVWRTATNINFVSDSRLMVGGYPVDVGIKVVRIPFSIYTAGYPKGQAPLIFSGDLGMACAGATNVALMMKEALAEVVYKVQGVPSYHKLNMDVLSDLLYRGFKVICKEFGLAVGPASALTVVFAGLCRQQGKLRAFRMEHTSTNTQTLFEVLMAAGSYEISGSGEAAARALLPASPTTSDFVAALEGVIADPNEAGVGGNLQFGDFNGPNFVPAGVAKLGGSNVQYLRGPLDLNGPDFDQNLGLIPLFLYVDQIR